MVIVGGGFGGLTAAKALERAPVDVTLVDRKNHHLFQPLLYQVASAGLSPDAIASPIRSVLRGAPRTQVLLDEVVAVDLAAREVRLRDEAPLRYDALVVATGLATNYFGHPEWATHALGLKDLDEAIEIRRRVLLCFETAEKEPDPEVRRWLTTFVVIGGGPTGVELAGALAELSRFALRRDFRRVDPSKARVILLEGGPRILSAMDPGLSAKAVAQLRELGVEVRLGAQVTGIDAAGVSLGGERLEAGAVVWAAGVRATPLPERLGVEVDRMGRIVVGPDCSIPGHPEAFVVGDVASHPGPDGTPLPGLAPVAIQQARYVAAAIRDPRKRERPFRYVDKGVMATIGRSRAVAQSGPMRLSGFVAWVAWLFIHLIYLIGHRNRLVVLFEWTWSYFTYKRGARIISCGDASPPAQGREPAGATVVPPARDPAPAERAVT